jgi:ATP-binding cassette subfamily A (ABC1) protein 4
MKRRLQVAMALTGGSKIIILDEPTSGLDPYNRRTLWELVRQFKKGNLFPNSIYKLFERLIRYLK